MSGVLAGILWYMAIGAFFVYRSMFCEHEDAALEQNRKWVLGEMEKAGPIVYMLVIFVSCFLAPVARIHKWWDKLK